MSYAITPENFKEFPSGFAPVFGVQYIGASGRRQYLTQAVTDLRFPGPDRVPAWRFDPSVLLSGDAGLVCESILIGLTAVRPTGLQFMPPGLQAKAAAFLRADALVGQLWPTARRRNLGAATNSGANYYGVGSMWLLPYAVRIKPDRPVRVPVLSITTNATGEIVVQVGLWGPYGLVPLRGGADALTSDRVAGAAAKLCDLERAYAALDPKGNNSYWAQRLRKDRLTPVDLPGGCDTLEWVLTREQCNDWPHHRTDTAVRRILRLPRSL